SGQAFAAHLISSDFKTPAIPKTHVLMSWTASIGLMWLAHEATRACGFGAFAFMIHASSLHPLDKTIDHLLLAGLFKDDGELVAVDLHHLAVAEFLVEHAVVERKLRRGAGGLCYQFAFDGHWRALVAREAA